MLAGREAKFPELFELNKALVSSNLIDSNYFLECESPSETALTRLLFLSSLIPAFLLEHNIKRCEKLSEKLTGYVKKIIDSRGEAMEQWEEEVSKINKCRKEEQNLQR
jgi:hypothetical protein